MKTIYDPESDSLYVRFAEAPVVESEEVAEGVILDFDAQGKILAFEFIDARKHLTSGALLPAAAK
jgi:uncharacterized protein YuzE